jgi:hypothetical protein
MTSLGLLAVLAGCATQPIEPAAAPADAPILDTSEERGACIGATARYETCTYAIAVFGPEAAPKLLVSRRMASTQDDGQPVWEELDRLQAPALPPGGSLELSSCRLQGTPDDTVVALLPNHDAASPEHIAAAGWAYRIELPSGRFAALDAGAVDCINNAIDAD